MGNRTATAGTVVRSKAAQKRCIPKTQARKIALGTDGHVLECASALAL